MQHSNASATSIVVFAYVTFPQLWQIIMTVDRQDALVSYVAAALRRARTPNAQQRPMEFFCRDS